MLFFAFDDFIIFVGYFCCYMISFNSQDVPLPDLDFDRVRDWIAKVALSHGYRVGNLSYLFVNDSEMLDANRKHLGHDYYTDIITFDYTHRDKIGGDMIISLDTVASNAELVGQPYCRELLRVIIHGVLHLTGIDDKGPGEREIMEAKENEALGLYEV